MSQKLKLFRHTPITSAPAPHNAKILVTYKLEYLQYSKSFKDRGISHMIQTLNNEKPITKLICSSGGNAGNAVAVAGKRLGIPVDIFVPTTTLPMMIDILKANKATVHVGGNNWNEANAAALAAMAEAKEEENGSTNLQYIPPFDHPLIWEGNSSLVTELIDQIPSDDDIGYFFDNSGTNSPPDGIILSVGGGGLLKGAEIGIERNPEWLTKTQILAVETDGAASFALAKKEGKDAKLASISTIATTLGALQVTSSVLDTTVPTHSVVASDKDAVAAALAFAKDYHVLVEPSCGVSLSLIYNEEIFQREIESRGWKHVVVVVCGGSAVSIDLLQQWKERFGL